MPREVTKGNSMPARDVCVCFLHCCWEWNRDKKVFPLSFSAAGKEMRPPVAFPEPPFSFLSGVDGGDSNQAQDPRGPLFPFRRRRRRHKTGALRRVDMAEPFTFPFCWPRTNGWRNTLTTPPLFSSFPPSRRSRARGRVIERAVTARFLTPPFPLRKRVEEEGVSTKAISFLPACEG